MGKEITEPNTLRAEAEARLFSASTLALSNQIADGLQYELDVHKIELEMQNEELRRAYADLDVSRDRYVDLYNFSPVGYLTITYEGLISETNLTTAKLFGVDRGTLLFSRFSSFLIPEDGDRWHLFFVGVIKKQNQQKNIQLTLKHSSGSTFSVLLNCLLVTLGSLIFCN